MFLIFLVGLFKRFEEMYEHKNTGTDDTLIS